MFNNGVVDDESGVLWTIQNLDGSTNQYAQIVSATSNSAVVKLSAKLEHRNKVVVIKATYTEDSAVFDEKPIKIVSFF